MKNNQERLKDIHNLLKEADIALLSTEPEGGKNYQCKIETSDFTLGNEILHLYDGDNHWVFNSKEINESKFENGRLQIETCFVYFLKVLTLNEENN